MNWESIKHIYREVLIHKNGIEYFGPKDRYKIIDYYSSGIKAWEEGNQNGQLHGKSIIWNKNGTKSLEYEHQNRQLHGKYIEWYEDGTKHCEYEYQNGKLIK